MESALKDKVQKTNAIILFTRIPVPGKTKTRLLPMFTMDECCLLQSAFLMDVWQVLTKAKGDCDIIVCYTPEGNLDDLSRLLPGAHLFFPQQGKGIGEKMHNAICRALATGYSRCILVGSDLPLLRSAALDKAFELLETNDMVLCPTEDGGYYLIGMKEPCESIFTLKYGISTVFEKTMKAAKAAGKTCATGDSTMDIDEPDDIFRLVEMLKQESDSVCPQTRNVLKKLACKIGTRYVP
ncbi:MAG: TIGR04282 family arsenosugar biosynthesis glycosyltransferase [Spirochaetes bacterium]|nr:TIGR04282 family arsenosugar biosynthesis glycosyltransferase [Spirochaetota bacterium]